MTEQGTVIFYHGTDLDSLLSILNEGLQADKLRELQSKRKVQAGSGWYVTNNISAAWYFASIAYGNTDRGSAVVEIELFIEHFELLVDQGLVKKSKIVNVHFDAEQYLFDLQAFEFLNQHAAFRPYEPPEE
ncbi:MAG: hypothetical protein R3E79_57910 [Caldilineaceae bacterium]